MELGRYEFSRFEVVSVGITTLAFVGGILVGVNLRGLPLINSPVSVVDWLNLGQAIVVLYAVMIIGVIVVWRLLAGRAYANVTDRLDEVEDKLEDREQSRYDEDDVTASAEDSGSGDDIETEEA